jgi:molecular chaperone GrpE
VLALADDFDRAIDTRPAELAEHAWVEGVTVIDRKLRALLESEGVTAIDASPGTPFDPREHDAIANVPNSGRGEGQIVDEVRRGYRLRDRVLRPALVAVAQGGAHDDGPVTQPTTPETRND